MDIVQIARRRHTVKSFDRTRKIPPAVVAQLRELLRLAPSSVNSQPWHFVIASTDEGKERIVKSTESGYPYNTSKVRGASHVVVLATRVEADEAHMEAVLTQEQRDGRFNDDNAKAGQRKGRAAFTDLHRYVRKDVTHWYEKQTYLALGTLLLGASALEVDATPMEGFDPDVLDEELGLRARGYTSSVIVSLGYSGSDDFNARLPKSRLGNEALFTEL